MPVTCSGNTVHRAVCTLPKAGRFVTVYTLDINVTVWARRKLSGNFVRDKLQGALLRRPIKRVWILSRRKRFFSSPTF